MERLRNYSQQGSEEAFAGLVRQHVNLVYSAALRQVGIAAHAEEITQAVFVILARKAARLRPDTILDAWLYQTTRLTALSFLRGERRRQLHEQEAYMQSILQESTEVPAWNQLAPLLDDAMSRLGRKDREAVVLRFFKEKSLREVAAALKVTEAAAQSRVHRAVEKLRQFFMKRGVALPVAALTAAISANSVQAAPVALAKAVTAIAVSKGAAAGGSTLTLIKGALKIMAWTKAKTVVAAGVAVLLATGTTVVVVEKVVSPTVDESFWDSKSNLDKAPPVLIIRPARYSDWIMNSMTGNDGVIYKVMTHNSDVATLLQIAYSSKIPRMILPADVPTNRYDLMLTLPGRPMEALQEALKRKFGFTAQRETRETDVLVLKVKDPRLLALHASKRGSKMDFKVGTNSYAYSNIPISMEAQMLEAFSCKPVIVQPGLSGNYDLTIQWVDINSREQAVANELAQTGLELVPSREPIEMLVVKKVK